MTEKEFTVDECEAIIDVLRAPGRHVEEWDGGWDDSVASALIKQFTNLRDRLKGDSA